MMTKEKLGHELSYSRCGYKSDRWKWVVGLPQHRPQPPATPSIKSEEPPPQNDLPTTSLDTLGDKKENEPYPGASDVTKEHLMKCYGLDKIPKTLPCQKRCFQNPWCFGGLKVGSNNKSGSRTPLCQQPREPPTLPVGLQNTANTCWINSALQLFFHLRKFRNAINSVPNFRGEESLDTLVHLLQVVFAEMETHPFKAIACEPGSVFEQLGMFASREVMKKDANNELLKCVSEFMENTIDWLVAETRLAAVVAPMFTITLTRLAKWQCSKCSRVHQYQLSPASCYTMGAYISADQAPLQQCLMDLQAETQTGVMMVCGGGSPGKVGGMEASDAGCGAAVKVDRVVTPKLDSLPYYLIIRNNSLIAEDVKRRLHVVYPENLNLSEHTLDGRPAHYVLSAVIFHHGHWVKHYSAQVQTEGGRWFSFNDEAVLEMNNKASTNTQANPQENHPNYFSLGAVSAKYKSRNGERVSRGAFIWLYTLVDMQPAQPFVPPQPAVTQFISRRRDEHKTDNSELLAEIQAERQELLKELPVTDLTAPFALISETLLLAWLGSQECRFVVAPQQLQPPELQTAAAAAASEASERPLSSSQPSSSSSPSQPLDYQRCPHGNLRPLLPYNLKCIRRDKVVDLLTLRCGIHTTPELTTSQSNPATNLSSLRASIKLDNDRSSILDTDVISRTNSEGSSDFQSSNSSGSLPTTSNGLSNHCSQSDSTCRQSNATAGCPHELIAQQNDSMTEQPCPSDRLPSSTVSNSSSGRLLSNSQESSEVSNSTIKCQPHLLGSPRKNSVAASPRKLGMSPSKSRALSRAVSAVSSTSVESSDADLLQLLATSSIVCGDHHLCRECVAKHARHILFLEHLRLLHKQCKKLASKNQIATYRPVGSQTLELWPKIATRKYIKDHQIEMSVGVVEESSEQPLDEDASKAAKPKSEDLDLNNSEDPLSSESEAKEDRTGTPGSEMADCTPPSAAESKPVEDLNGFQLFNEDLVCCHHQLNPQAVRLFLPEDTYAVITELCGEDVHPATVLDDFQPCTDCQSVLVASESACERGLTEKKRLTPLFMDRKRPQHGKDSGLNVYLLDRDFYNDWRAFVRSCMRGSVERRPELSNEDLLCEHGALHYSPALLEPTRQQQLWVLLWQEEWDTLEELYGPAKGGAIRAVITHDGFMGLQPDVCSVGCVESQAIEDYEDQFEYESELLYVRQVHSPSDIPQRSAANTRSMGPALAALPPLSRPPAVAAAAMGSSTGASDIRSSDGAAEVVNATATEGVVDSAGGDVESNVVTNGDKLHNGSVEKRQFEELENETPPWPCKMARLSGGRGGGGAAPQSRQSSRKRTAPLNPESRAGKALGARLVRASKNFASTDTIRQVQNFIAERTSVWPMLQTVWLCWSEDLATVLGLPAPPQQQQQPGPVLLEDDHLTMTLGALRIRPGDTIYFKAAKEDMEKAAGDGVLEYDELPL